MHIRAPAMPKTGPKGHTSSSLAELEVTLPLGSSMYSTFTGRSSHVEGSMLFAPVLLGKGVSPYAPGVVIAVSTVPTLCTRRCPPFLLAFSSSPRDTTQTPVQSTVEPFFNSFPLQLDASQLGFRKITLRL